MILHRCINTKSVDGGSGGPRIPCDGAWHDDCTFSGGCDEPCRFAMAKAGEGEPPIEDGFQNWLHEVWLSGDAA